MEKRVLFIENTQSFLTTAVKLNMEKEGFIVGTSKIVVDDISSMQENFSCFFINIERDSTVGMESVLVYLRDLYLNTEKKIFLMGESADIDKTKKILGHDIVLDSFIRPINARTISDRVVNIFNYEDEMDEKKNILVVDDSGSFLHMAKEWLEPTYKVTMLNSATSAIAYLGTHRPDLILLDYEMPICSGPMMLEMIRADSKLGDIPVIFLTGNSDRASIQKVLALKPQGYLLKSLSPDKILESLHTFFENERHKKMLNSNGFV